MTFNIVHVSGPPADWDQFIIQRTFQRPLAAGDRRFNQYGIPWYRGLLTLAIETSCDDTSVAILEKHNGNSANSPTATLHFHEKITSNNAAFGGIHPLIALQSHQENLASLVAKAIRQLPSHRRPDFISVTRGPGMRTSLQTGLDTAKGLAVAWQVPLVGVHHMQAHALTPRFVSAVESKSGQPEPEFPFLSLLVSGGHTLLIHSKSLVDHQILASTSDSAIGDCLDKVARAVLPPEILESCPGTMYGAALERYAFSEDDRLSGSRDGSQYGYTAPQSFHEELMKKTTTYGWALKPPLSESPKSLRAKSLEFSFTGLTTQAERIAKFSVTSNGKIGPGARNQTDFTLSERKTLAQETMRLAFEHLVGRVILSLEHLKSVDLGAAEKIHTLVVSGGVAANGYLRHM